MRLIDADALDKKLFTDGFFGGLSGALNGHKTRRKFTIGEIRTMLERAPTVDAVPVWISVDERLPEEMQRVLFCSKEGFISVATFIISFCCDDESIFSADKVTHWQPLPLPPGAKMDSECGKENEQ